jgi:thiosulfate/3-mercaptopyruvate sulfurtransferase
LSAPGAENPPFFAAGRRKIKTAFRRELQAEGAVLGSFLPVKTADWIYTAGQARRGLSAVRRFSEIPMAHSSPLVTVAQLQDWLQQEPASVLVLDASFDLADAPAGRQTFRQAHLPGAAHIDLDIHLSSQPNGSNGRHPLPDFPALAETLARLGADNTTRIVAYDRQGAMYAARAWWLLRRAGHAQAFVLDGGLPAWQAAGLPVEDGEAAPRKPGSFRLRPALVEIVDYETLRPLVEAGTAPLVVDARAPDRFRGENETLDRVGGHIPGARNRFFRDNLDAQGRFLEPAALRAAFETVLEGRPAAEAVMQCGSGVTACHNLLALEVAGLSGARLYPGSWSEWSSRPGSPVATGTD